MPSYRALPTKKHSISLSLTAAAVCETLPPSMISDDFEPIQPGQISRSTRHTTFSRAQPFCTGRSSVRARARMRLTSNTQLFHLACGRHLCGIDAHRLPGKTITAFIPLSLHMLASAGTQARTHDNAMPHKLNTQTITRSSGVNYFK